MDLAELERKLLAAAKASPPGDHVPHAFEQRILARLNQAPDPWAWWTRALWRAAAPSLAVMLLLAAWTIGSGSVSDANHSLATDLETTLFAVVDDAGEI